MIHFNMSDTVIVLNKDKPDSLLLLIDKFVQVNLIKDVTFSGFLHSIDPITLSIILTVPLGEKTQITLIPGHAILNISTPKVDDRKPLRKPLVVKPEDMQDNLRKEKLLSWFKLNLLPVSESGDNIIIGNIHMIPPYNVNDICTDNPLVALQVRKLIERMPDDFSSEQS